MVNITWLVHVDIVVELLDKKTKLNTTYWYGPHIKLFSPQHAFATCVRLCFCTPRPQFGRPDRKMVDHRDG